MISSKIFISLFFNFLAAAFISGCSTSTIYLNDYNLKEHNTEKVRTSLEREGYKVKVISVRPPNTFDTSTVVSGSKAIIKDSFDQFMPILNDLGYDDIEVAYIETGNHWYRDGNIGLYLVDKGYRRKPRDKIAGKYIAESCASMKSLTLYSDSKFSIEYTNSGQLTGVWKINEMPYVNLSKNSTGLNFYYKVEFETQTDFSGKVDIVSLHPLESESQIKDCVFAKGVRRSSM